MGRGGCLGRGQGAARAGDEMMGTTHMAGNPMVRRLLRARAGLGQPVLLRQRGTACRLEKNCTGSFLELREVVGGGASEYGDASHSSLDGALAPSTAEMLLSSHVALWTTPGSAALSHLVPLPGSAFAERTLGAA